MQAITEQTAFEKDLKRRIGVPEGHSSMVEYLTNMCKAPGSIPSTAKEDNSSPDIGKG